MFRITFSPNGLTPFVWKGLGEGIATYERAVILFNLLSDFDLGQIDKAAIDAVHGSGMIDTYKAYRRKHGINHPDMIATSVATIDQRDSSGNWWIVSEHGYDDVDFYIGSVPAFDNDEPFFEGSDEADSFYGDNE